MSQVANVCFLKPHCSLGGQIGPHDFSGECWGLRTSQPPGLFLGVWLWLLLSTGGLSVCSSWRVWREQISAEITPWQQDTLLLPGNVGAGRAKGQKGREESLPHTHTNNLLLIAIKIILKVPYPEGKIHCSAKRFWLFCIWHSHVDIKFGVSIAAVLLIKAQDLV